MSYLNTRRSTPAARVDSASALVTLPLEGLTSGAVAQSRSPRATWVLQLDDATAAAEGLVIANGSARWFRVAATDAGYQHTTEWWVRSSGDWRAAGTSAEAPTTPDELVRRLNGQLSVQTLVNVLDDIDLPALVFDAPVEPNAWLELDGAAGRTTLATGTVTAHTLAAVNVRGSLTASIDLTAHVGRMLRVTSGPRAGTTFAILGAAGGGGVEVLVPQGTPYYGDAVTLQSGDAIAVEQLPQITSKVHCAGSFAANFTNLDFATIDGHSIWVESRTWFFNACTIGSLDAYGGVGQLLGCYVSSAIHCERAIVFLSCCGVASSSSFRIDAGARIGLNTTLSLSTLAVGPGGFAAVGDWFGVLDTGTAVQISPEGELHTWEGSATLWGAGLAPGGSARAVVDGRLRYAAAAPPSLAGTGTVYKIGGVSKTAVELSTGFTAPNGASAYSV